MVQDIANKETPIGYLLTATLFMQKKKQELKADSKGKIELYYADESQVYVQMVTYSMDGSSKMSMSIFHPKTARLNIFGMITKRNQYKKALTQESTNKQTVDFLDRFSF